MVKTEPAHERITSSPGMLRIDEAKSPESHRSRSNPSPDVSQSTNQNQPASEPTNQTSSFHSSIIQNSNSVLRSAIMPTSSVPNHYPVRKCPMTSSDISCLSKILGYQSSVICNFTCLLYNLYFALDLMFDFSKMIDFRISFSPATVILSSISVIFVVI